MNAALIESPIGPLYVELDADGALTRLFTAEHADEVEALLPARGERAARRARGNPE